MNERELSKAVEMITALRREGKDVEECTRILASAGFTHEEIEKILDESDKMM
jgi:hypothetical protein